jgi:hypothetical protein
MRIIRCHARAVTLSLLLTISSSSVFAYDIETFIDMSATGDIAIQEIGSTSINDIDIHQDAGDDSDQTAAIDAIADTIVDSTQTVESHLEKTIEQICPTGSGSQLCVQDASPLVVTLGIQNIDALSENLLSVLQQAGTGSTQVADVAGDALTDVTAVQTVTSDTVVEIFQDCTVHTGVCVQRALPEILTLASQVIAAAAYNTLDIVQEAQSGSVQIANVDLAAQVTVDAQQIVHSRTFLALTQLCQMNTGMCIQRALPIIETAVEQVIDAQSHNDTLVLQEGADTQVANLDTDSDTDIIADQTITSESTIEMLQNCGVAHGLCLRVDANGHPTFVFTDGEERVTGDYTGELDETEMMNDYSRQTVGHVASGVCGGESSCSMVERLLFWLFGPEPEPEPESSPSSSVAASTQQGSDESSSRRGHETNVLSASLRFMAQNVNGNNAVAPAAFGGMNDVISPAQKTLLCSVRRQLLKENRAEGIWVWSAEELSRHTDMTVRSIIKLLKDESICPQITAALRPTVQFSMFPVSTDGPVSSNALWNKCVRGESINLADVKANPDRDEDGTPRTCASYHTGVSWYHPDLGIRFEWDRTTGYLQLPDGFVPEVMEI